MKWLLLFTALFLPGVAAANISVVNSWGGGASSGTTYTLSIAPTNGDTIIVAVSWPNTSSTFVSLKDNNGVALTQDSLITDSGNATIGLFHESNVSGVTSVALHISVYDAQMITVLDVSGLTNSSPGDVFSASYTASSSTTFSMPAITTVTGNDIVIGVGFARGSTSTLATSSPWTAAPFTGNGDGTTIMYQVVSSATSYTPKGGNAGAHGFIGISGSYKASGGGGTALSPSFAPSAGLYAPPQSVTLTTGSSGAIICYNTSGSPATNGTTGCTTGTLYSGPISLSTETVYAVAGGTGFTDSAVSSAAYTIASPTNPISYNAITNTSTYSGAAPTLGAAGTTTTDPDFGTKVLRVTDRNSYCGTTAGRSYSTMQPGSVRTFNAASPPTAVLVMDAHYGEEFVQPVTLSGSTMSSNPANCVSIPLKVVQVGSSVVFSAVNPNLVYGVDSDGNHFDSYNWSTLTKTQLYNISTMPGMSGFTGIYLTMGDAYDHWFCGSNSTQGSGTVEWCYNLQNGNTTVLTLSNATFQLNSGSQTALDNLTSAQLAGCTIHATNMFPPGNYVNIGLSGCSDSPPFAAGSEFFWEIGTNHVTYKQDAGHIGGHGGEGWATYVAGSGGCSTYQNNATILWPQNNYGGNPGNWAGVTSCAVQNIWNYYYVHYSYLNDYNDAYVDQYPVFMFQTENATNLGTAYENEVVMVNLKQAYANLQAASYDSFAGTNPTVWRIAHTYNDPQNTNCPWFDYTMGQISGDGHYAAFLSDWLGGTGTGVDGCPGSPSHATDFFIVALPTFTSATSYQEVSGGAKISGGVTIK